MEFKESRASRGRRLKRGAFSRAKKAIATAAIAFSLPLLSTACEQNPGYTSPSICSSPEERTEECREVELRKIFPKPENQSEDYTAYRGTEEYPCLGVPGGTFVMEVDSPLPGEITPECTACDEEKAIAITFDRYSSSDVDYRTNVTVSCGADCVVRFVLEDMQAAIVTVDKDAPVDPSSDVYGHSDDGRAQVVFTFRPMIFPGSNSMMLFLEEEYCFSRPFEP